MSRHFILKTEKGMALIAAVFLVVVFGFLGLVAVSSLSTQGFSAMNEVKSDQAFFIAEGGGEFSQRFLAQNLDWYRSTADPILIPATNLGAGAFNASMNLPVTKLRRRIPTAASTAAINVYTTSRFPAAGTLQIDDNITDGQTEYVSYTGTTANSFTGITRDIPLGAAPIISGAANPHERGTRIYPVTTLLTALGTLGGVCSPTAAASFNIATHSKFLAAGIIDIEGEEIGYSGSTISGGTMTLLGVTRCLNSTSAAHAANQPVTPLLVDGASPDFQTEVISTGTVGVTVGSNAVRVIRKTVQR